jgi:tRNA threonylcarbamoyladenosine biosynthesis protein TsaB
LIVLLAIDTATRMTGLALYDGSAVLAEHMWRGGGHHTTQLAPEIGLMLRRLGVDASVLTAIAVASGPGSYTGLRIGMALGKGLALAQGIPLIGIPTLDILVEGQDSVTGDLLALIQAGRSRFAGVWYNKTKKGWAAASEPKAMTAEDVLKGIKGPTTICGEMNSEERRALQSDRRVKLAPPSRCVRRPAILAEMAWDRLEASDQADVATIAPTYLAAPAGSHP